MPQSPSSTLDYRLSFDIRTNYLSAYVTGERASLAIARRYWREIAEKVIELNAKKLFVVEDIPEAISISDVHQLVSELAELPVKGVRVAFVDRFAQHKSINDFGALVGGNRGLIVHAFDDVEAAEAWLLSD